MGNSTTEQKFFAASCGIAVSIAPSSTFAQTIDHEQSTTVETSTANSGAPADITITEDGAIIINAGADIAAVTIDSDNAVINDGLLSLDSIDGGVGVLIESGRTGSLTSGGDILLSDGYDREDTDDDGDLDGPYAIGSSRTGVLLEAGGAFTGDIVLAPGSTLTVDGDNSSGVSLLSHMDGSFINDGSVAVTGDNAIGIDFRSGVSGDILQSGSVIPLGENASGVAVNGDVGGSFTNEGLISATGFASTTITNYADPDDLDEDDTPIAERIDADDLQNNGPVVAIGGSVSNGFLNNGIIDGFIDDDEAADETKDTIEDFDVNRSTGSITSYGSGPALIISPDLDPTRAEDIVFGSVVETIRDTLDDDEDEDFDEEIATFSYSFGLINRGTILANGLNVGYEATAVRIEGSADGMFDTFINGGIENTGSITASAFEADSVSLSLGRGAVIGRLDNAGLITASVSSEVENAAVAFLIESGAELDEVFNTGTISASAVGNQSKSYAIRDLSGSLVTIENQGTISGSFSLDGEQDLGVASGTAIDLSSHSSAQSALIRQTQLQPTDDINGDGEVDLDDVNSPRIFGDIKLGAGDDLIDIQAGVVDGDLFLGDGDDVVQFENADFVGGVFGAGGDDSFTISGGVFEGELNLGAGNDSFTLLNGSGFVGTVTDPDMALDIVISNSAFELINTEPLTLGSLIIENESTLTIAADAERLGSTTPQITVIGPATISADTDINATVESFSLTPVEFTLIEAGTLNIENGEIDDEFVGAPAIFSETVTVDANSLRVRLAPKSAEELGLNSNESAAYSSFLTIAAENEVVGDALKAFEEVEELKSEYRDVLPDYTDAMTRFLSDQASVTTGSIAQRLDQISAGRDGFWLSGAAAFLRESSGVEATGYSGLGVIFQSGYDGKLSENFVLGGAGAMRIGKFEPEEDIDTEIETTSFDLSVYSSLTLGQLQFDVSGIVGKARFYSDRTTSLADTIEIYRGDWGGFYYSAGARVGYDAFFGQFHLTPLLSIDHFSMSQNSYVDSAGGADLLALSVGDATTTRTSGAAMLKFGRKSQGSPRSQLRDLNRDRLSTTETVYFQNVYAGYRTEISEQAYEAEVSFISGGESFSVFDPIGYEDAILVGASLGAIGDGYILAVGYDGQFAGDFMSHRLEASFNLSF